MTVMRDIKTMLFSLSNAELKKFNQRLIPNIDSDTVIGVKTPELKNLAADMIKNGEDEEFLSLLPHEYFEENQLHAFIISKIKDLNKCLIETERFLPHIDNWATCDQLIPIAIARDPESALAKVYEWLKSGKTYTVRFAIGILMRYFLDERFDKKYIDAVAAVKSEEYYINMMCAWYLATALAKQYESTVTYFENNTLNKWVHNKSIRKAIESYRVKEECKTYLKKLKR